MKTSGTRTHSREVAVFLGEGAGPKTMAVIQTLVRAFPAWRFFVLQQRREPSLRNGCRRAIQAIQHAAADVLWGVCDFTAAALRARRTSSPRGPRKLENVSAVNLRFAVCADLNRTDVLDALADAKPWLGVALDDVAVGDQLSDIPRLGTVRLWVGLLEPQAGAGDSRLTSARWGARIKAMDGGKGRIIHERELTRRVPGRSPAQSIELVQLGRRTLLEALTLIDLGDGGSNARHDLATAPIARVGGHRRAA